MVSIESILQEELQRLREAEQSYRREIRALPKGSIQNKRIKGIVYPYLAFRKGKRVVSRYLGNLLKEELERLRQGIALRRQQEQMLLQVRKNMFRIKRMI